MFNVNKGYVGFSMSVRANEAYESAEMPRSKWTKKEMLDQLEEQNCQRSGEFKKFSAEALRHVLLESAGWHHTSKHFNKTNFYRMIEVEEHEIDGLISKLKIVEQNMKEDRAEARSVKEDKESLDGRWKAEWDEWEGTRKHPKRVEKKDTGRVEGAWFYPDNEFGKKRVSANSFRLIERI